LENFSGSASCLLNGQAASMKRTDAMTDAGLNSNQNTGESALKKAVIQELAIFCGGRLLCGFSHAGQNTTGLGRLC